MSWLLGKQICHPKVRTPNYLFCWYETEKKKTNNKKSCYAGLKWKHHTFELIHTHTRVCIHNSKVPFMNTTPKYLSWTVFGLVPCFSSNIISRNCTAVLGSIREKFYKVNVKNKWENFAYQGEGVKNYYLLDRIVQN